MAKRAAPKRPPRKNAPAPPPSDFGPVPAVRTPVDRLLRVFAIDPSLAVNLELVDINEATIRVAWEADLRPGPVGEYIEVVDVDPASGAFYPPVDLNERAILAQHGLTPGEGDPRFHQQMVYAVAMRTIRNFELELGRRVLWSERASSVSNRVPRDQRFVRRLRVYPHALREANAYYSPDKKALLFGYFPAVSDDPLNLPGGLVFSALSHDVIAHETTHAILDGIHPRYAQGGNLDMHAFHEAFADIVALFQHFQMPEVLRHQMRRTRGDLSRQNLLGELAVQFGQAIGNRGALRDAIGSKGEDGRWRRHVPTTEDYDRHKEPHRRGAVLVAAVFDAFLAIYRRRTADLIRLASDGASALDDREPHPDLVTRLCEEAAKVAGQVLGMCIRALDYCPPVDLTFGDYLRALITADTDADPRDALRYRVAFVEAFRCRGILPQDIRSLSPSSLRWSEPTFKLALPESIITAVASAVREDTSRKQSFDTMKQMQQHLHEAWFPRRATLSAKHERALGLVLHLDAKDAPRTVAQGRGGRPLVEVHSVRPAFRTGPSGRERVDIVIELTQRRRGYVDPDAQRWADEGRPSPDPDFWFRGGCTMLIDYESGEIRYCITKNIRSESRLKRQAARESDSPSLSAAYGIAPEHREPFALLHRQTS